MFASTALQRRLNLLIVLVYDSFGMLDLLIVPKGLLVTCCFRGFYDPAGVGVENEARTFPPFVRASDSHRWHPTNSRPSVSRRAEGGDTHLPAAL
jgi:hypothetical protein